MPTTKRLLTSVNSDSGKGRRYVELCRAQYDGVGLDEDRAQFLNENKAFPAALRLLIEKYSMPVQAPKGGRIHVLRVPVNPSREWQEAINAAGPNTGSDWAVRKVGDQYPVQEGAIEDREIILVNFGKTIPNVQHALDWAEPFGLQPEGPRSIFAIGEHKPQLHKELEVSAMAVISTVECSFEGSRSLPHVWWYEAERDARLGWFGDGFDDYYWFAFSRK